MCCPWTYPWDDQSCEAPAEIAVTQWTRTFGYPYTRRLCRVHANMVIKSCKRRALEYHAVTVKDMQGRERTGQLRALLAGTA